MQSTRFIEQLRRNRVALISLVVAIVSLSYNSWRNEASEDNRTQRLIAVEVLHKLADLQEIVWYHHYDKDTQDKGNLRGGWAIVITIRDVSTILNAPLPDAAAMLWKAWDEHHVKLIDSTESKDAIIHAIEMLRADTLMLLQELD